MKKLLFILLLFSARLYAQTTVTATVTDPNGNAYARGTASAYTLVASGQTSTSVTPVPTDTNGSFTMTLSAGTYIFTVCAPPILLGVPNTASTPTQICFSSGALPISGSGSLDIGATLSLLAPVLGPKGTSGGGVAPGSNNVLPKYVNGAIGQVGNSGYSENAGQTQATINEALKVNGLQPYNMGILDDGANTNNCSGMNTSSVGYYAFCGFSGGPLQLWYNGANSFGNVLTSNLSGAANGLATLDGTTKVPTSQLPNAFGSFADTFTGATADIKLNACLAAATNKVCDARGLNGAQTIAATVNIPANTVLLFGSITATCTITNGTACFSVANSGGMFGPGGGITNLIATTTTNASAIVTNADHTGAQNTVNISGIHFQGNASATLPQVVDLQAIYDPSYFVGNVVDCFPSIGVHVRSANGVGLGPLHFRDNTINGTSGCTTPNNRPVVFESVTGGGFFNFDWQGGGIEHPGNGQAMFEINGNGIGNSITAAFICVPYFENAGTGLNAFKIRDANNVTVCPFSTGGPAFTDVVNISQSAVGLTNNIRLEGINYNNAATSGNTYNNTITSETSTQQQASYYYGGYALNTMNPVNAVNLYSYNLCSGSSSTGCTNYERLHGSWVANNWTLTTESAGTGSLRGMTIGPGGANNLAFQANGTQYWYLNGGTGFFDAITDAVSDIGESGHRPRNGLFSGTLTGNHATPTNCQLGGATGTVSPAACVAASSGVVAIPASQTTYTINTTAITANSHIFLQQIADNSGIPSSPTCNATATNPIQTARVAATSFTFTLTSNAAVTCYQYFIVD